MKKIIFIGEPFSKTPDLELQHIFNQREFKLKSTGTIKAGFNNNQALVNIANVEHIFETAAWKGGNPPVVGEHVLVEKINGVCTSVKPVTDEELIKIQGDIETEKLKNLTKDVISGAEALLTKHGLYAFCLLVISAFFINCIEFFEPFSKSTIGISFYDLLGLINSGNLAAIAMPSAASKGTLGFLFLASLTGPFWSKFTKDARAYLGFCAPLVFAIYLVFSTYQLVMKNVPTVSTYVTKEMIQKLMTEAMANIHFGIGAYGIAIGASYLAIIGIKKFLVAKALQH